MSTHQNTHKFPPFSTQLPTTPGNIMARNAFGDAQSSVTTKVEAALRILMNPWDVMGCHTHLFFESPALANWGRVWCFHTIGGDSEFVRLLDLPIDWWIDAKLFLKQLQYFSNLDFFKKTQFLFYPLSHNHGNLGGGFNDVLFSPLFGEDSHFD